MEIMTVNEPDLIDSTEVVYAFLTEYTNKRITQRVMAWITDILRTKTKPEDKISTLIELWNDVYLDTGETFDGAMIAIVRQAPGTTTVEEIDSIYLAYGKKKITMTRIIRKEHVPTIH